MQCNYNLSALLDPLILQEIKEEIKFQSTTNSVIHGWVCCWEFISLGVQFSHSNHKRPITWSFWAFMRHMVSKGPHHFLQNKVRRLLLLHKPDCRVPPVLISLTQDPCVQWGRGYVHVSMFMYTMLQHL